MNNYTPYWLAARRTANLGIAAIQHCQSHHLSIRDIFTASAEQLREIKLSDSLINAIQQVDWQAIEQDINWCQQHNTHIITLEEANYPDRLRHIPDQPFVLFAQGNVELLHAPSFSIVGARRASHLGLEYAEQFAYTLATHQLIINSGLALGIDGAAHTGALQACSASTVAVLGSGLQHLYPRRHLKLAQQILAQDGLIVSEFPPDNPPHRLHFPRRNRIISGLAQGILVVEAARKSGSLITADFALEQGREVFAIPGAINNPLAEGCHDLIKQGATLVQNPEDILQALGITTKHQRQTEHSIEVAAALRPLLKVIDYQPTNLDKISQRMGYAATELSGQLLALELQGLIHRVPGGYMRV